MESIKNIVLNTFKEFVSYIILKGDVSMSLLGNTEHIKTKNGDYIEIRRGMFHTHVALPDGTELELDCDFDELVNLLNK